MFKTVSVRMSVANYTFIYRPNFIGSFSLAFLRGDYYRQEKEKKYALQYCSFTFLLGPRSPALIAIRFSQYGKVNFHCKNPRIK